jgi:hypothetical protein
MKMSLRRKRNPDRQRVTVEAQKAEPLLQNQRGEARGEAVVEAVVEVEEAEEEGAKELDKLRDGGFCFADLAKRLGSKVNIPDFQTYIYEIRKMFVSSFH